MMTILGNLRLYLLRLYNHINVLGPIARAFASGDKVLQENAALVSHLLAPFDLRRLVDIFSSIGVLAQPA